MSQDRLSFHYDGYTCAVAYVRTGVEVFAKEERQSSNDTEDAAGVPPFPLQELSGPCATDCKPLWRSAAKVVKDGRVVWLRFLETRLAASPRGAAQLKTSEVSPSVRHAGVPTESWE